MGEHTDYMNDMVLLGIDRDSWKARAENLKALNAELVAALEDICIHYPLIHGSPVPAWIRNGRIILARATENAEAEG